MTEMVGGGEGGVDLGLARGAAGQRPERLDLRDDHVLVAPDPLEAAAGEQQRLGRG